MAKKLTVKQAAEEFFQGTISPQLIYQECRAGRMPHVKVASKVILDEDTLQEWWQRKLQKSIREEPPQQTVIGSTFIDICKYGTLRKIAE